MCCVKQATNITNFSIKKRVRIYLNKGGVGPPANVKREVINTSWHMGLENGGVMLIKLIISVFQATKMGVWVIKK